MTMHERVSGVWKEITGPHEKVSGVWKEITEGWVNVSGVWKQFYTAGAAAIALVADLLFGTTYDSNDFVNPIAALTITVKRNGTWTVTGGAGDTISGSPTSGDWADTPAADSGDTCTVQFITSGLSNSPTINNGASSPTALTSDRTITISKGSGALAGCNVQIIVSNGEDSVDDTCAVTVQGTPL